MGERESRDTGGTARSLNVVHYIERDLDVAARLVAGHVERSADSEGSPSLLAILPTADNVFALSESVFRQRGGSPGGLTPMTAAGRARRVLATGAPAVAGTPSLLARLVSESGLVVTHLQTLVLVWPEEILAHDDQRALLESVIAEVPRSAERIAVCAQRTTELAQFLERAMWRAREMDHSVPTARSTASLRVIVVPPAERVHALRSVLDAFDPVSAVLLAATDEGETSARNAAAIFGSGLLDVVRGTPERRYNLGIILDEVPSADTLTAVSATVDELVAIVRPSRLTALQKVAGSTTPMTWTGAIGNARTANDALRDEIRGYASSGGHAPWIPIVEPLLEDLDPVEVAATALALLDRERRKAKRAQAAQPPAPAAERAGREERSEGFRPRPPRRDDRGDRTDRGERGGRPDRGFPKKSPWAARDDTRKRDDDPRRGPPPRRDRDERPPRDDRGSRGPRGGDDIERVPRAAREGREWTERGERLRNSRRGPRGGDAG